MPVDCSRWRWAFYHLVAAAVLQKCWGEALGRVYSTSRGLSCICVRLGHPGLDMDNLEEVGALCIGRLTATLCVFSRPAQFSERRRCSARGAGTSTRVRSRRGTARSSSANASTPRGVRASVPRESLPCQHHPAAACCSTGEPPPQVHTNPCSNRDAHKSHPETSTRRHRSEEVDIGVVFRTA